MTLDLSKKISTSQIKETARGLSAPIYARERQRVRFEVYKAKDFFCTDWNDDRLAKLVFACRRSFLRYGKVPLQDKYDDKSAVYLARATYNFYAPETKTEMPAEEWLSLRFIPGHGTPESTDDLDVCIYRNKPIKYWLLKHLTKSENKIYEHLDPFVTISRFSKISPYFLNDKEQEEKIFLSSRLNYIGELFTLINHVFLQDCEKSNAPFRLITCMLKPEIEDRIASSIHEKKESKLSLDSADKFFRWPKGSVKMLRGDLSFSFPGYFFGLQEILLALKKLIESKKLSHFTLLHYLDTPLTIDQLIDLCQRDIVAALYHTNNLSKMFFESGRLHKARIGGKRLRSMAEKEITGGPSLKVEHIDSLRKKVSTFLKNLSLN